MIAYAESTEGSLSSGYYITTNWHGIDVPLGAEVTATAKTTDHDVDKVTFVWLDPEEHTNWTDTVPVQPDGTYHGKTVYSASSTHTPEEVGDWTVKALFVDNHSHHLYSCSCKVPKRATSFFVIPEIPIIGTAGVSIAVLAGLAVKMKRKPQK
jgi:hypothetical protein